LKAPPNDDFESRIMLRGAVISETGTLGAATTEPGEPDLPSGARNQSVWWSWIPPLSGTAVLSFSSDFNQQIAVYTGSQLTNLTLVVRAHGDPPPYFGQLAFDAVAGIPCQISFASSYENGGNLAFSLFLDARQLGPLESLPDGRIHGAFQTTIDETWVVEASDDLIHWSSISTNVPLNGTFEFDDSGAADQTRRFYRVKSAR
jgi:hypothetical protein